MDNKIIKTGRSCQEKIIEGVNKAVDAIKISMGPSGHGIAIADDGLGCQITRDGATIAKNIRLADQEENIGAELVKKAAALTEEKAGDSTSTCSLFIQEFCKRGQRAISAGANVNEIKAGMLLAGKWVTEFIKANSIPVNGDLEKVCKVATISANNDPEVGSLVAEGFKTVGFNGLVTADTSSALDTTIEVTTGMKLDKGWCSPQYVTNAEEGKCVMEDAYILVASERISSIPQIVNFLQDYQTNAQGRPLLIICDDIDETVNAMFVYNTIRGAIRCCVVKGVEFGDTRKNTMEDIAVVVGATHIIAEAGLTLSSATLSDLGQAKKVVVGRDSCIIYNGAGNPDAISQRASIMVKRLEDPTISDYDKTKFEKRIANLTGGIAVIKAGGASEAETANRKATIEDAILAAKCAIEEGCSPGGGYTFFKAAEALGRDKSFWSKLTEDEREGAMIVQKSLPVVLTTIAENSGVNGEVILRELQKIKKPGVGFDAKTKSFVNLEQAGILDSAKCLRVSIENSISAASMILLIDCTITKDAESDKNDSGSSSIF
jgi:chaperonin GroEL